MNNLLTGNRTRVLNGVYKLKIDEQANTLICEQKYALKYFFSNGLIALTFKKGITQRTFDINVITNILCSSTLTSGNLISLIIGGKATVFDVASKADLIDCIEYLKSTKLAPLINSNI